ncbi:MAG: hypothetical protein ABIT38_22465 [Gemmatimonadaceae bacterium]
MMIVSSARSILRHPRTERLLGMTLVELAAALAIAGIVMATAIPRYSHFRDRLAVYGATSALTSALADTRHLAARWNRRTALAIDTSAASLAVHAGTDTVTRVPLGALFQVGLAATRDSIAYYPSGLGYGASNATLIVRRGTAAETVTVSRIGRVKR